MKKSGVIFEAKNVKSPGLRTLLSLSIFSILLFFAFQKVVLNNPHQANATYSYPSNYSNAQPYVTMQNMQDSPNQMTIPAGTTVTWGNKDNMPHTVTSTNGYWDLGVMQPGQAYGVRFMTPGVYNYYCRIHPNMQGRIVVTGTNDNYNNYNYKVPTNNNYQAPTFTYPNSTTVYKSYNSNNYQMPTYTYPNNTTVYYPYNYNQYTTDFTHAGYPYYPSQTSNYFYHSNSYNPDP